MTIRKGALFGAYHRVSQVGDRDVETDAYMTEDVAWEQIDGWAKMRGVKIADHYLDRDVSGKSMDRPDLNRLMEDLRLSGRIEGVAVTLGLGYRLSRASVVDALKVVGEINEMTPRAPGHSQPRD